MSNSSFKKELQDLSKLNQKEAVSTCSQEMVNEIMKRMNSAAKKGLFGITIVLVYNTHGKYQLQVGDEETVECQNYSDVINHFRNLGFDVIEESKLRKELTPRWKYNPIGKRVPINISWKD